MVNPYYESNGITIYHGDCREALPVLAACSIDSIVCDPPYELGFMGKRWDRSGIAYDVNVWRECLRVLRPGGHMLAFGGSRTYHRLACAIEDAGFEIRDQVLYLYGSGFPKSLNVSKAIDSYLGMESKVIGQRPAVPGVAFEQSTPYATGRTEINITRDGSWAARQWDGYGTALKPAHEPIVLARKPLDGTVAESVLKHGTGGLNIDACRIGADVVGWQGGPSHGFSGGLDSPEPDGRPVEGRWPANVIHDGSDEVLAIFPETSSGTRSELTSTPGSIYGGGSGLPSHTGIYGFDDSGSAARYFYCTKASKADREEGLDDLPVFSPGELTNRKDGSAGLNSPRAGAGRANSGGGRNTHPTVKPTDLMRYLCRLITPPRGIVLDPFCGSGSTGKAAVLEDFEFIGIELNEEYCRLAQRRIEAVTAQRGLFTPAVIDRPQAVRRSTVEQDDLFAGAPQ